MDSFTLTLVRGSIPSAGSQPRLVKPPVDPSASVRVSALDVRVGKRVTDHLDINFPAFREALRQEAPSARPLPGEFGKELQRILDELRERLARGEAPLDAVETVAASYSSPKPTPVVGPVLRLTK